MGVGDLTGPPDEAHDEASTPLQKHESALAGDDAAALEQALARNVFAGGAAGGVARLAAYVRHAAEQLDAVDGAQFLDGLLVFPAPRAILAGDDA
jgi:hypothetical protein